MDFLKMSMDIDKIKNFQAGLFDKIEGNRKRLNKALESGTAVAFHGIYHETINNRIRAICDALGMDLNGSISPKITALKKKFKELENMQETIVDSDPVRMQGQIADLREEQQAFIEVCQLPCKDCKLNELKEVLQKTLKKLADVGISGFIDEELLEELDSVGEKEGDCEIADIKGRLQQLPADSKPTEPTIISGSKRPKCKECGNLMKLDIMTLNKSDWYCPMCKKLPDSCKECGGYRMGEKMMHKDWCSQCTTSTTQTDFTDMLLPDHKIHYLKTIPEFFQPLLERKKTFELRLNDRDFKVGDFLSLMEYNRNINEETGRQVLVEVTYILKAEGSFFSFLDDYCIMGIKFL